MVAEKEDSVAAAPKAAPVVVTTAALVTATALHYSGIRLKHCIRHNKP